MIDFQAVIVPLTGALGLSLIVERTLEVLKNIFETFSLRRKSLIHPDLSLTKELLKDIEIRLNKNKKDIQAEDQVFDFYQIIQTKKNELEVIKQQIVSSDFAEVNKLNIKAEDIQKKINDVSEEIKLLEKVNQSNECYPQSSVLVEPASRLEESLTLKRFVMQIVGFAVGIVCARVSEIGLFNVFLVELSLETIPISTDYILTGLLIGGGSGPLHTLIRFITQRKVTSTADQEVSEETDASDINIDPSILKAHSIQTTVISEELPDIKYEGGVDRDILESAHLRNANPTQIIYHHTAMSCFSSFWDVVKVIKDKDWLTGYHCVVLRDGNIHPFCRWDRYGNHALGHNRHSLGLSFNGNFETNPQVTASNWDGRYGPQQPTEVQLKAGARVIALWLLIYNINLGFDQEIIPHNQVSDTVCPGNCFPQKSFEEWIAHYHNRWIKPSSAVDDWITTFKLKRYLFV